MWIKCNVTREGPFPVLMRDRTEYLFEPQRIAGQRVQLAHVPVESHQQLLLGLAGNLYEEWRGTPPGAQPAAAALVQAAAAAAQVGGVAQGGADAAAAGAPAGDAVKVRALEEMSADELRAYAAELQVKGMPRLPANMGADKMRLRITEWLEMVADQDLEALTAGAAPAAGADTQPPQ